MSAPELALNMIRYGTSSQPCSAKSVFPENIIMHERLMDAAAIQSVIASRLPQRARWRIGNDTQDFSLHSDPCSLAAEFAKWGLSDADLADIEHGSDLIVFGMWNYNEGGGARPALVVRQSDGKVFGVDVEANDPLFVLNSSLEAFIDTFCLLDKYLGDGQPIPADLNLLVRNLDPTVYSESDWRDLVDHVAGL